MAKDVIPEESVMRVTGVQGYTPLMKHVSIHCCAL